MGRSQETFSKKEKEKKRIKKRQEKQLKREERKANSDGGGLDNMLAYVDEFGNISDTPPDPTKKKKIKASDIELGVPKNEREDPEPNMGRITHFNTSKGYGFIKDRVTQENYFFHVNGLLEDVEENDLVTFDLERGQKGMNAVQVKKVKEEPVVKAEKVQTSDSEDETEDQDTDEISEDAENKVEDSSSDTTEE